MISGTAGGVGGDSGSGNSGRSGGGSGEILSCIGKTGCTRPRVWQKLFVQSDTEDR